MSQDQRQFGHSGQPHGEGGGLLILTALYAVLFWGALNNPIPTLIGGSIVIALLVAYGRWSRGRRHRHSR